MVYRVKISRFSAANKVFFADFQEILGEIVDQEIFTKALLSSQNFTENPFSEQILKSLPDKNFKISDEELASRDNYLASCVYTIDPETARDLDDAISCELVSEGASFDSSLFRVAVHIADVSHFVKAGSELDKRASQQVSTVYLVQRAVHLLPDILSCDLCSLNEHKRRLTFSVEWLIYGNGDMAEQTVKYGKGVIESKARLHYGVAQEIIEGKYDDLDDNSSSIGPCPVLPGYTKAIVQSVKDAARIATNLRQARKKLGMIEISVPRLSFEFDDNNNIIGYKPYEIKLANNTVEEFMLMANNLVAQRLLATFPSFSILRNHRGLAEIDAFNKFIAAGGVSYSFNNKIPFERAYSGLLSAVSKSKSISKADSSSVSSIALAVMALEKANYVISCAYDNADDFMHRGIATPVYMHFTSPIRRYPDTICHRLLQTALELERSGLTFEGISHQVVYKKRVPFYNSIHLAPDMGPNRAILAKAHEVFSFVPKEKTERLSKAKSGTIEMMAEDVAGIEHLLAGLKIKVIDDSSTDSTELARTIKDDTIAELARNFEDSTGLSVEEFKDATEYYTDRYLQAKSVGEESIYFSLCSFFMQKNYGFVPFKAYYVSYDEDNEAITVYLAKLYMTLRIKLETIPCDDYSCLNNIVTLSNLDTGKALIPEHLVGLAAAERAAKKNPEVLWEDTPLVKKSSSQLKNETFYQEIADKIDCDYDIRAKIGPIVNRTLTPLDSINVKIRAEFNPVTNLPYFNVILQ